MEPEEPVQTLALIVSLLGRSMQTESLGRLLTYAINELGTAPA